MNITFFLLAHPRKLQLLIVRIQIFPFKYRSNLKDQPFTPEPHEHGRSRASALHRVWDLLHWTEGKAEALGRSCSSGSQGDSSVLAEKLNVALEKQKVTDW